MSLTALVSAQTEISGELKTWHKITLSINGPETSETDAFNPFLNYRLNVRFYQPGHNSFLVPGYYAGDGDAGETSASEGSVWKTHFSPDRVGTWYYEISFRQGSNVAVSDKMLGGDPIDSINGMTGQFEVADSDKTGRDLRAHGRLQFVDKEYLQFSGSGNYFLKVGADAPENLLAYADFDGDFATDGRKDDLVKTWSAHVQDWNEGDPTWQGGKGKGLIGALNYLAEKGMNAISFLPLNIAGDDKNVYPYISYDVMDRIDVSKMDQWEVIFNHADRLGIFLHFKTSEVENQGLLDNGDVGLQRKLYYRELIARFGHHLALNWNIGEENGLWGSHQTTPYQTTSQRLECARYFYENDPYHHHIVIHNGQQFYDLLGPESKYTGLSLQTNQKDFSRVHQSVLHWRNTARKAKKVWAIAVDEPGDAQFSLLPDKVNPNHDNARQNALWGGLMAGAWGIEWYFGYKNEHSDLTCEDWRSRDLMWDQSRYALDFFVENNLPFWKIESQDDLTQNENDYVSTMGEDIIIVFQKIGEKQDLNLLLDSGEYRVRWYNPRSGKFAGDTTEITVGDALNSGAPPAEADKDWVILIQKQ